MCARVNVQLAPQFVFLNILAHVSQQSAIKFLVLFLVIIRVIEFSANNTHLLNNMSLIQTVVTDITPFLNQCFFNLFL